MLSGNTAAGTKGIDITQKWTANGKRIAEIDIDSSVLYFEHETL